MKGNDYFELLKFLITYGYIDETYPDYLSYFYENSLSATDKIFLRSITDRKEKEYSYSLKEPAKVAKRLSLHHFEEHETLNFDLLFYLLKTPELLEYTNTLFRQLKQTSKYSFIQSAFLSEQDYDLDILVNQINSSWPSFFSEILVNNNYNKACRDDFILRTLYKTPDEDIELINIDECLTEHISHSPSFLKIGEPDVDRLVDRFKLLQVKFTSLDYEVSDKVLFHEVYNHDLYELNFSNIQLMLKKEYHLSQTDDFFYKNLTIITTNQNTPLSRYVWENIDEYISIILNECKNSILDVETVVIQVLNSNDVSIENKKSYIEKLQTIISELRKIKNPDLWKQLLEQDKIRHTELNIIDYFLNCKNILSPELKIFIDVPNITYNFSETYQYFKNINPCDFFIEIVKWNDLNYKHYHNILSSLNLKLTLNNESRFDNIIDEKFSILIEIGVIEMLPDTLIFIREHYINHVPQFIKMNIKEYTELVKDNNIFVLDEMIMVLSLEVDDSYKITLLGYTKTPISIFDKKYSDRVKIHILTNNFHYPDIEQLLCNYPQESENIKRVIEDLTIEHKDSIIASRFTIPYELLDRLISSTIVDQDDQQQFFLNALDSLDQSQCRSTLKRFGFNDYEGLFHRKHPKFEINDFHKKVLSFFKKKGWINKFDIDKDDSTCYRAYGRQEKKQKNSQELSKHP